MNQMMFLNAVKNRIEKMSKQEQSEWILRMLPFIAEDDREEIVNLSYKKQEPMPYEELLLILSHVCDVVQSNDSLVLRFSDESDWNYDSEYYYSMDEEVSNEIMLLLKQTELLVYHRQHVTAFTILDQLFKLDYQCFDENEDDYEVLSLSDLMDHDLIAMPKKEVISQYLYLICQCLTGPERIEKLQYHWFAYEFQAITLQDVMAAGLEGFVGLDSFLEDWISYAMDQATDYATKKLVEASMLKGDVFKLIDVARKAYAKHPLLYLEACQILAQQEKAGLCISIGLEALDRLPKQLLIRAKISNCIATIAKQRYQTDIVELCFQEAFYAESSVYHLLRLYECVDYQSVIRKALAFLDTVGHQNENSTFGYMQIRENQVTEYQMNILHFFAGEFDAVFELYQSAADSYWKNTMTQLFMLALIPNISNVPICRKLVMQVLNKLSYQEDEMAQIFDLLLLWKEKVQITAIQYERYMPYLLKQVDSIAQKIVGNGKRNEYAYAATIIVAAGEMLESRGAKGRKAQLAEQYKMQYFRKTAFKKELISLLEQEKGNNAHVSN